MPDLFSQFNKTKNSCCHHGNTLDLDTKLTTSKQNNPLNKNRVIQKWRGKRGGGAPETTFTPIFTVDLTLSDLLKSARANTVFQAWPLASLLQ